MNLGELPPDLADIAKKELGETDARRVEAMQTLRIWMLQNPHLPEIPDDEQILPFLRVCKYSLERTKERIELYFTMKTIAPEIFSKWDPLLPDIQEYLKLGIALPLPGKDKLGRSAIMLRMGKIPAAKFRMENGLKIINMIHVAWRSEINNISICGEVVLDDMTGLTAAHAAALNITVMKKAIKVFQDCAPTRMKGIHMYNPNPVLSTVMNLMKSLMKDKLRNRIHVHGNNPESLLDHFPRESLPPEYGGTGKSVKELTEYWKKRVEEDREVLKMVEKQRTDESKRIGPVRDWNAELFGIEGSFRKLEID